MGAWGAGPFENDDASDWVWELEDDNDASVIIAALDDAIDPAEDYIDADTANNAIAAAEIVASSRGQRHAALPTEAVVWLDASGSLITDEIVELARTAVARILEDSETRDLWAETGNTSWVDYMTDLASRLG